MDTRVMEDDSIVKRFTIMQGQDKIHIHCSFGTRQTHENIENTLETMIHNRWTNLNIWDQLYKKTVKLKEMLIQNQAG